MSELWFIILVTGGFPLIVISMFAVAYRAEWRRKVKPTAEAVAFEALEPEVRGTVQLLNDELRRLGFEFLACVKCHTALRELSATWRHAR